MKITIYRNGEEWETFQADEIDIRTSESDDPDAGAIFMIGTPDEYSISVEGEADMLGEFGENKITLTQS